ncbi:type VII secretion-associated protein [Mycolicibacterium brumae]|uniref:Type VII secretion-associated protein n=1 Tax=Mycolicibacterium brumae TaxID=85968 RepID=A0A2G5PH98_9MYCO|nr:type VII secretion-associated protein [Mycolicibacterium brumae]MCV7194522.1 type VII secretion-associated protein [Mycolicibacterium brumae]PIB77679.1 type VII secretion-associated protein [Mycolicibacterium brumae]RWA20127.1 hypothetical protein MBRU_15965 [Mycolicibacterium brumae DSM 44177]UWW10057.1 type VII secretion-associated protein [Mycolicibacterium brumae]
MSALLELLPDGPAAAALHAADDPLTLLGEEVREVDELWRDLLAPLRDEPAVIAHPTGWPPRRIARVAAIAAEFGPATLAPRAVLCAQAGAAVVEIDGDAVLIADDTGTPVALTPRRGDPATVAEQVAAAVTATGFGRARLDAPDAVPGATALATLIIDRLRDAGCAALPVTAAMRAEAARARLPRAETAPAPRLARRVATAAAALILAALVAVTVIPGNEPEPPPDTVALLEGRLAVRIPAGWATRRVTTGPGSARVEVSSPADPTLALHLTQARVGADADGTAAAMRRAIVAAAAPEVFVDFRAEDTRAGRPAVTYRELRPGREIRWTVLTDRQLRIGVGCQSAPGNAADIDAACATAVASAHAVG